MICISGIIPPPPSRATRGQWPHPHENHRFYGDNGVKTMVCGCFDRNRSLATQTTFVCFRVAPGSSIRSPLAAPPQDIFLGLVEPPEDCAELKHFQDLLHLLTPENTRAPSTQRPRPICMCLHFEVSPIDAMLRVSPPKRPANIISISFPFYF